MTQPKNRPARPLTSSERTQASRTKRLARTGGKRVHVVLADQQAAEALERVTRHCGSQGKAIARAVMLLDAQIREGTAPRPPVNAPR